MLMAEREPNIAAALAEGMAHHAAGSLALAAEAYARAI
jgi:hypothetical protein